MEFSVLTYNVHSCIGTDRRLDIKRVAEVIAACDPDVIALQELDVGRARTQTIDQAEAIAEHLRMKSHFHPALHLEEEQYGDAIMTAHPSELVRAGPLPSIGEPRGALWVEVRFGDFRLNVLNTHFGLRRRERLAQTMELLGPDWLGNQRCRDNPTVFVGDLNALPGSRELQRLKKVLVDQTGSRRSLATFPSLYPLLRLDHVMHSGALELLSLEVITAPPARRASDHLPILARFNLNS
ncbi:EEP domain-containing protein [Ensifer sp. T173]|uniref:EEP domain-containing protein n=1 Tax=Ensifer canadensis TaxID=555315 RepID=A0AAW4FW99_9HYPH|nr:endonuclease/exonuclease/phosphatase family protein [Ensifer canadensis]MBM3095549.1 EEP domain-containing protein [Ensifer canadensis]UBI79855.1 endonuclease/exonuclease/phosphatase family protein [Ensifer canadensis]